nr:zinc ribbon domain-containing protein [uncultured Blautia sp.]
MAKDFFGGLSETISKTARELSGRAEEAYETQRIKNKISGEERQVEKAMADLGRIIYKRYKAEIPVDDAQKALCEQIDQRMEQIAKYKSDISELKVKCKRFCPACGSPINKNDAFCSQCGAACPTEEPEEKAGDDVIEGTAEEVEKVRDDVIEETAEEVMEAAEEASEEVSEETAEENTEDTSEKVSEEPAEETASTEVEEEKTE